MNERTLLSFCDSDTLTHVFAKSPCATHWVINFAKRPLADIRCIVLLNKIFDQGRKRAENQIARTTRPCVGWACRLLHLMRRALLTIASCEFSHFECKNVRCFPFTICTSLTTCELLVLQLHRTKLIHFQDFVKQWYKIFKMLLFQILILLYIYIN